MGDAGKRHVSSLALLEEEMTNEHLRLGELGEALAEQFLRQKGLRVIERRVRVRRGELDLVAKNGDEWIFIEVKTRSRNEMGGAIAAFSRSKESRMKRAVEDYVHVHGLYEAPIRCDVVAVDFAADGAPEITHYPGCVMWR